MSKVVAITGGFGSLGVAVGRHFKASGWRLALIDRSRQPFSEIPAQEGQLLLGGVELTDAEAARRSIDAVMSSLGQLDALINVAGGFRWETVEAGDLGTWDLMYQMNVRTAVTMSKAALKALSSRGDGRIVNIAAGAAIKASAGMGSYAASKAGVMRFTEALADEMKDKGVTVNAILPSIIDTPQNRKDMPDADFTRWVKPERLAEVIFFLTSPAAQDITGAAIAVNGRV